MIKLDLMSRIIGKCIEVIGQQIAGSAGGVAGVGPEVFGETELERAERRAAEYFLVIEKIERQRNTWTEMYREQVGEHLAAQSMLERALMNSRQQLARAIKMLNDERAASGKSPVAKPSDLDPVESEPVGLVEKYAERMLTLQEELKESLKDA